MKLPRDQVGIPDSLPVVSRLSPPGKVGDVVRRGEWSARDSSWTQKPDKESDANGDEE